MSNKIVLKLIHRNAMIREHDLLLQYAFYTKLTKFKIPKFMMCIHFIVTTLYKQLMGTFFFLKNAQILYMPKKHFMAFKINLKECPNDAEIMT